MTAIKQGKAHYKEEYVLKRLFEMALSEAPGKEELKPTLEAAMLGIMPEGTEPLGVKTAEAEAELAKSGKSQGEIEALFQEGGEDSEKRLEVMWEGRLGWMIWAFVLYGQGVSLSAIGGWLGVNKSTVCWWLIPIAKRGEIWLKGQQVAFSGQMAVDKKWVWVRDPFEYLFVAVDCQSGYPLHVAFRQAQDAALYPTNGGWAGRLFLLEVKRPRYKPVVIVTDGWDGYIEAIQQVFAQAEHLLCRFQVLKALFRRLRKAKLWEAKLWELAKKLFKSQDKRTGVRRVKKLQSLLREIRHGLIGSRVVAKLPKVLPAMGSTWRSMTSNAAESFFSAFDRFYRMKGPFQDEASARKHVSLFVLY